MQTARTFPKGPGKGANNPLFMRFSTPFPLVNYVVSGPGQSTKAQGKNRPAYRALSLISPHLPGFQGRRRGQCLQQPTGAFVRNRIKQLGGESLNHPGAGTPVECDVIFQSGAEIPGARVSESHGKR